MDALRDGLGGPGTEVLPEEQARHVCAKPSGPVQRAVVSGPAAGAGRPRPSSGNRAGQDSLEVTLVEEVSQPLCSPHVALRGLPGKRPFLKSRRGFTGRCAL